MNEDLSQELRLQLRNDLDKRNFEEHDFNAHVKDYEENKILSDFFDSVDWD